MDHFVEPSRETLHGTISRHHKPILKVDTGDTVVFHTLDGLWGEDRKPDSEDPEFPTLVKRDMTYDYGHALSGPVYVNGAEPGDVLEIRINELVPSNWGWHKSGCGIINHDFRIGIEEGKSLFTIWDIDAEKSVCRHKSGLSVPMAPFMGVMCVAPDVDGHLSTYFPYQFGGNLDCRELTTGTKLYLPVYTEGALFSTGDGHAAQGDGEASGTAIECPMRKASMTFTVHKSRKLEKPIANTPSGWITFGFSENLTDAAYDALNDMIKLIMYKYNCERMEAIQIASLAVDLKVTQIVNTVRGVHAVLPEGRINRS